MSDLREKIAEIVREACQTKNRQFAYVEFSDAILSLPELKEALAIVISKQAMRKYLESKPYRTVSENP